MTQERVDIFIAGGGIAGLVAAAGFGHAGFSVLLADPSPPAATGADPGADLRSTAFLRPALALFQEIGLWPVLEPHAVRLDVLRVIDTTGMPPIVGDSRSFSPEELGEDTFGWNLPNWLTRAELLKFVETQPNIELAMGTGFAGLMTREAEAFVSLTGGRRIRARLVIGADGRDSAVRDAAGIETRTWRYGQKVLAFNATHPVPHGNVSTEIYNQGGAFTTVPLADIDGTPASAIVWMNHGPEAQRLAGLAEQDFNAEMTLRSCGLMGPMQRSGGLSLWPVITRRALQLTAERVALVAEAAHALPPIGAQGLNTSLHDVAALLDLARAEPQALGSAAHLSRYARRRAADIALRAQAIDLFNRVCKSPDPTLQSFRRTGLKLVHDLPGLRRAVMRAGLGRR